MEQDFVKEVLALPKMVELISSHLNQDELIRFYTILPRSVLIQLLSQRCALCEESLTFICTGCGLKQCRGCRLVCDFCKGDYCTGCAEYCEGSYCDTIFCVRCGGTCPVCGKWKCCCYHGND